jgi:hypothetical protein
MSPPSPRCPSSVVTVSNRQNVTVGGFQLFSVALVHMVTRFSTAPAAALLRRVRNRIHRS